jgi:hypothetical protein
VTLLSYISPPAIYLLHMALLLSGALTVLGPLAETEGKAKLSWQSQEERWKVEMVFEGVGEGTVYTGLGSAPQEATTTLVSDEEEPGEAEKCQGNDLGGCREDIWPAELEKSQEKTCSAGYHEEIWCYYCQGHLEGYLRSCCCAGSPPQCKDILRSLGCPMSLLHAPPESGVSTLGWETAGYFTPQLDVPYEDSKTTPFVHVPQALRTQCARMLREAGKAYVEMDKALIKKEVRLGQIMTALADPELQVVIVAQALERSNARKGGDKEAKKTNANTVQQGMYEAAWNPLLRPLVFNHMTGPAALENAIRDDTRLFEVIAFINLLSMTNDSEGARKLCQDLDEFDHTGLLVHECSYKVYQKLGSAQFLAPDVGAFLEKWVPSSTAYTLAMDPFANYVLQEIMVFGPPDRLEAIVASVIQQLSAALDSSGHHVLQLWLKITRNAEGVESFTHLFEAACPYPSVKTPAGHVSSHLKKARHRLGLHGRKSAA